MHEDLERLRTELAGLLEELDNDQTQWRPRGRPEAWSIQQIVEHLNLSYATTLTVVEARLEKGKPVMSSLSVGQRAAQLLVVGLGYMPRGREAPSVVVPRPTVYAVRGGELSGSVEEALGRMDSALDRCEGAFGSGRAVNHIVLGPMSVRQWRRFHLVHGRHHAKQIAAIRAERGV